MTEETPAPVSETNDGQGEISNADQGAEDSATEGAESAGKKRMGRAPYSEAERQRRATYRACEKAKELLTDNGFQVTTPDGWEDPDVDRKRQNALKAIEELRAAGVDVSTLIPA